MTLDKENMQKMKHKAALLENESLKERLRAQSKGNIDIKIHMYVLLAVNLKTENLK